MKRTLLLSGAAALVALFGAPATASAHGHHHHAQYMNYSGVLVDNQGDEENDDDVVSVAEPAYYAPVQSSYYTAMPTQYVPVNDTIVTPYGYTPQYNNGYYQGYGYNPVYANNPYYAGATYGGDPVAATVVNTLVSAATNGGHVDSRTIVQSLLTGLVASQLQSQYQQQPSYGQPQPYYQPQYVQQYQPVQVYQQPQPVYVQQVIQRYVPVIRVRGDGERHGDGEHRGDGGADHGDHGGD